MIVRRLEPLSAREPDDNTGVLWFDLAAGGKGIIANEVDVFDWLGKCHFQPQCVIGSGSSYLKQKKRELSDIQ